ncbi:MAG: CapA family protein [Candidatus Riflebacteria bacterium]|nr:CapA family protein [Candidatus Riflebacteria bacterium]
MFRSTVLGLGLVVALPGMVLAARGGFWLSPVARIPPPNAVGPVVAPGAQVLRLAAVGDVMVYQALKRAARQEEDTDLDGESRNNAGWNSLFEDVSDILHTADLGFANLESPILPAPSEDPWFLESGAFPLFKAPPELAAALRWANFSVVSLANNHSMDQGGRGVASSLEAVKLNDLTPVGAGHTRELAEAPEIQEIKGITIGWLGATALSNKGGRPDPLKPQVAMLDEGTLPGFIERVRSLRQKVDVVILSVHWGEEEKTRPREREVRWAHALCEAGVDVVLGHHPHVLQPVEVYPTRDGRTAVVAYSLGNFVSANPRTAWRDGAILIIEAARTVPGHTVRLTSYGTVPTWTDLSDRQLRVVATDRLIRTLKIRLEDPDLDEEARASLEEQLDAGEKQAARVRTALGSDRTDLLGPHPPISGAQP